MKPIISIINGCKMEELNVTHCSIDPWSHGVRQGGVLSPYFFAIAVDEMLIGLID